MNKNNLTFRIDNWTIDFPRWIKTKDKTKYYDFKKVLNSSVYSRKYQLNHRSVQAHKFDALVDVDYFQIPIIKEFVVINRARENDRSYYLIDYYIPTKGIAIELDSNLHDKKFDQIKDRYLFRYHGIRVIRYPNILKDFRLCVEDLRRNIHLLPDNYITFNYSDIIEDYIRSKTRSNKPPKP